MIIESTYKIDDIYGDTYYLTEEDLLRKVKSILKNKEELIMSAISIIRVCEQANFSKRFANGLKLALLQYFVEVSDKEILEEENLVALSKCYNSLGSHEKEKTVKNKFLICFLRNVCVPKATTNNKEKCGNWIKTKYKELSEKDQIYFQFIIRDLKKEIEKELR